MAINIEDVKAICKDISARVEKSYGGLSLYFIIHPHGKMKETMAVSEHEIVMHPAGEAARVMLRKHHNGEKSSFLGLAISNEKKLLGLQSKDHLLGLYTLNINDFKSLGDAKAHIYHSAWHAIDLYEIRKVPQYRKKFRSGPMVPKRSDLNLSKANLQADVFSMMLLTLEGQSKAIDIIGKKRGLQSINQQIDYQAENFPTVIAVESCKIGIEDLISLDVVPDNYVTQARNLSVEIGQTYDEENIQQWWNFTIPAQDMAWRGFTSAEVLHSAIYTSHDPYVRSTGLLVAEITGIDYETDAIDERAYNAFTDPDKNINLHRELVDSLFEEVIQQGVEEASYRPFLNAANKQNEGLTNGNILGWCANALQDAANAFERAMINGTSPDQAARMQFESNKDEPEWTDLKKLSDKIIEQKRQGVTMTMGHIAEICDNQLSFSPMLNSVTVTMKDPAYIQKLEAANDLNAMPKTPAPAGLEMKGPAPSGPAPTQELAAAPKTPAPAMPAPGMGGPGGMGGGGNSPAQIMYQKHLAAKRAEEEAIRKSKDSRTE